MATRPTRCIKTDSKAILSLILLETHFTLIDIIKNPDSDKVVKYFDNLEEKNFKELIPVILTDRDPCLSDIIGICFSKIINEERWCIS